MEPSSSKMIGFMSLARLLRKSPRLAPVTSRSSGSPSSKVSLAVSMFDHCWNAFSTRAAALVLLSAPRGPWSMLYVIDFELSHV